MLVLAMQFSRNEGRDASGRPPREKAGFTLARRSSCSLTTEQRCVFASQHQDPERTESAIG
jgi:hypothetical protein